MPRTFRIPCFFVLCLALLTITALSAPATAPAYTVKSGDTPGGIAQKHGMTTQELLKANPGLDPKKLRVGQEITVPGGKSDADKPGKDEKSSKKSSAKEEKPAAPEPKREQKATPAAEKAAPSSSAGTYTVQKGDTPQSIAAKIGVSVPELLKANDNLDPRKLRVGQTLKAPGAKAEPKADKAEPKADKAEPKADKAEPKKEETAAIRHKVKRGETLGSIAARYNTAADDIARANKGVVAGKVKAGMVLTIPAGRAAPAPARPAPEEQPAPLGEDTAAPASSGPPAAPPEAPGTGTPVETATPEPETGTPADAEAYFEKGNELGKQNKYQKAIEQFDRAIKLNPNRADYYASRGHAFYYMKLYTRAIEDYTRSIDRNPSFALAYSMRGLSHTRDGHFDLALEDYNKAISLGPKEADYYKGRGYTYFHLKQYGPMCEDYQKACSFGDCELLETAKRENLCKAAN